MRSNIPCTWDANSAESRSRLNTGRLLEGGEEVDQVLLLRRWPGPVPRHVPRADVERARDRGAGDLRADVSQVGAGPGVAVVLELVTRQAARLRRALLALLVLWRHRELDLGRRPGLGAEEGQVRHRDDRQDARRRRDRAALR